MAKLCIKCGNMLNDEDMFCGNCGTTQPAQPVPPQNGYTPMQPVRQQKPDYLRWIIVAIVVCAVGFGAYSLFSNRSSSSDHTPTSSSPEVREDPVVSTKEKYVGKWVGTTAETDGTVLKVEDIYGTFIITLNADDTVEVVTEEGSAKGRWSVSDKGVTIDNELELEFVDDHFQVIQNGVTIKFEKQ